MTHVLARWQRSRPVRAGAALAVALALVAAAALLLAPSSVGRSDGGRVDGPGPVTPSIIAQPQGAFAIGRAASWRRPARTPGPSAAPAPAPAPALAGLAVGVQLHAMWDDYSDAQRLAVLDRIAAAHLRWVRIDMGWSSFSERCRGCVSQWYLDRANFVVDAARQRGLRVLVTAWRTPGWANNGAGELAPPDRPADFGEFMAWLAARFRGRVSAYEIWNEPDSRDFFTGSVGDYAALARAAYPAVRSADPGAQVVLGGPINNNTDWLRSVYRAGVRGSFDVLATHPYMGPADLPPETPDRRGDNRYLLTHVAAVHRLMAAHGDGGKPIWFTEFGWSSHPNRGGEANWDRGVSPQQQADYTVRAIRLVRSRFPYVTNMLLYNERNRATGDVHLDNYGMLHRDLSEKPVYAALRAYLSGRG
jgi:polysaccharide biosynthesis protein PslG